MRRLLVTVILCVLAFAALTFTDLAGAAPPGISDCKDAPTPQMPGRGFSGSIDSGPSKTDPNATSVYETVQYPPQWHTYDLGCGGGVRDPAAVLDTTIGNWIKGVATSLVALCNSLHRFVSPPTFLDKLDPLVVKATASLRDALYLPWLNLSLLVLAVIIIYSARKQNLPSAVEMIVWAILIMGLITVMFSYPVQASHLADDVSTSTVGEINAHMLGESVSDADPSSARAAVLTDNVLYKQWLQGELGSSDSAVAKKYGRKLLEAQTYTYVEAKIINDSGGSLITDAFTATKRQNFKDIAAKIEHEDPDAYTHLQGKSGSRIGAASWSLLAAISTTPFMIMADFLIILGLLIIRLAVIILPALGPLIIHHKLRTVVISLGKIVAAALINMVFFATGAAINALVVGLMLGGSTGLPFWANLLICLAISMLLWGGLKPFRKLTAMVSASSVSQGAIAGITLPNTRRSIKRVAGIAAGVWAGATIAGSEDENEDAERRAPRSHNEDLSGTTLHSDAPRAESWSRPAIAPTPTVTTPTPSDNVRDVVNERTVPQHSVPAQVLTPTPAASPALPAATPMQPAPPGTPVIVATTTGDVVPVDKHDDIYPADQPLPARVVRANPIIQDGVAVYRIWDSETKDFITVNPTDGSYVVPSEDEDHA